MTGSALLLLSAMVAAEGDPQASVHSKVRAMMEADEGDVVFTDLYNGPLSPAEREYAARLYEVFFAIPDMLRTEYRATGRLPGLEAIAANYGIPVEAADLLLTVMASDRRMPELLARDAGTGAPVSVDLDAIDRFVEQRGSALNLSGWPGRELPELRYTTLDGAAGSTAELRGRPLLVYLWLTRCPVCRRNTPDVVALHERFADRGLEILGLNADAVLGLDVPDSERRAWVRDNGMAFPNAMLEAAAREALGNPNIFPTFFLVDAEGRVAHLALNFQDAESLAARVEPLLSSDD